MARPTKTIRFKYDKSRDSYKFYKEKEYLCTITANNLKRIILLIKYYGTQTFMAHSQYLNKKMEEDSYGPQFVESQKRERFINKYEGRTLEDQE